NGGVLTVSAGALRDALGKGRLGRHVRTEITRRLEELGLDYRCDGQPDREWKNVRVYRRGSRAGEVIRAVLEQEPKPEDDELLRAGEGDGGEDARALRDLREILRQIL